MAVVINSSDYLVLANNYSQVLDNLSGNTSYFFDSVYQVVLLEDIYPTIDLVNPLWSAYELNAASEQLPAGILAACRSIQFHVIERGGYADIDAYLVAEGILVPQSWADLSERAGFPIDDTNIEP